MKQRAVLLVFALVLSGGAQAQSNEDLKSMLEQALKTIQDLQNRVKALEDKKPAVPEAPLPGAAAEPPRTPAIAPDATVAKPLAPEQPAAPPVTARGAPVIAPDRQPGP